MSKEPSPSPVGPPSASTPAGRSPRLVVIDGPAGAGKTTVARRVAAALSLPLLDTGAIYRTLALAAVRAAVAWDDEEGLGRLALGLPIRFVQVSDGPQQVWLGDQDVSAAIRTPEISQGASKVSALPAVRAALLGIQRALGAKGCVAEGRDMGTVVFPNAPHKFFVTAELDARAARRHAELQTRTADGGSLPSVDAVAESIRTRDARDSSRQTAPLARADDAILVDTTRMDADAVVQRVLDHVRDRSPGTARG